MSVHPVMLLAGLLYVACVLVSLTMFTPRSRTAITGFATISLKSTALVVGSATILWLYLLALLGAVGQIAPEHAAAFVLCTVATFFLLKVFSTASAASIGAVLAGCLALGVAQFSSVNALVMECLLVTAALLVPAVVRPDNRSTRGFIMPAIEFVAFVAGTLILFLFFAALAGLVDDISRSSVLFMACAMLAAGAMFRLVSVWMSSKDALDLLYRLVSVPPDEHQLTINYPEVTGAKKRRAWIISYTGVSNEPRVLRQCQALSGDGWEVVVCGFEGHSKMPDNWIFVRLPSASPLPRDVQILFAVLSRVARFLLFKWGNNSFIRPLAHVAHATNPWWFHINKSLRDLARQNPHLKAELVVSHDYHTSNVGYAIAQIFGAKFSIDVHEYAREQYSNNLQWVRHSQPTIIHIQDYYLARSDTTTVVCDGIGNLLVQETPIKTPLTVVRNVPFKQIQSFRPTSNRIQVLYHGDLSASREIHTAIESVPLWRPEFSLVLRGSGSGAYMDQLHNLVKKLKIEDRIFFEPSVAFNQIVPTANLADIGFFSYAAYSPQIQYALPNKIFEYVMAGLALCIPNFTEVAQIVNEFGNGVLIQKHSPQGIASAVNAFNVASIDRMKKASLAAAEILNWETERERLLIAYRSLFEAKTACILSSTGQRRGTS